MEKFPQIQTERFLLRQFDSKDLNNVFEGLSNPEVIKYYGISFSSLEDTKEQIEWFKNLEETGMGIWWAICSQDDKEFYGAGGFNDVNLSSRNAEVGFWLLPQHWGKGIMTEVMPRICRHAFENMNLHRIQGFVDVENENCKKALVKLKFKHEGTFKENEFKDEKYLSTDVFAMLSTEFKEPD